MEFEHFSHGHGRILNILLFLQGDSLDIQNLVVYILTAFMDVVVFFAGMWSTHALMANRKEQELFRINEELDSLHNEILAKIKSRELESAQVVTWAGLRFPPFCHM